MPIRLWATGLACVTSWKLVSSTTLGGNPTPVIGWLAGWAPVVLRKLPGLTLTPFSARDRTRAAAALAAFVKLTVNPSAFIDTHEAFFCTARALLKE